MSNCTDYLTRQLAVRLGHRKQGDVERKHVHALTASLFSTAPLVCALLEQHQTAAGVAVPEALRPAMWGRETLPFTKAA